MRAKAREEKEGEESEESAASSAESKRNHSTGRQGVDVGGGRCAAACRDKLRDRKRDGTL